MERVSRAGPSTFLIAGSSCDKSVGLGFGFRYFHAVTVTASWLSFRNSSQPAHVNKFNRLSRRLFSGTHPFLPSSASSHAELGTRQPVGFAPPRNQAPVETKILLGFVS